MTASSSGDGDPEQPHSKFYKDPIGSVRHFLVTVGTGCKFAVAFARPGDGVLWVQSEGLAPHQIAAIDEAFIKAAGKGRAVGVVLPFVRDEGDLIRLFEALAAHPRWQISLAPTPLPGAPPDAGLVRAEWTTDDGSRASTIVLGPSPWQPVHRRAPYFTLMSWTGGRENTRLKKKHAQDAERAIGFIDMPIPEALTSKYAEMWQQSLANAKAMRDQGPAINKTADKDVSCVLSPDGAAKLRALLGQ